ncbi:hypothetical protein WS68_20200 [Burkholderia sp. TSV86]|nr:hypothetical protein WS68_20200 [Burkholderia sp. TSV86]
MMVSFIDEQRASHGVESICRVLSIAPSTYFRRAEQRADSLRQSARARRDAELSPESQRVYDGTSKSTAPTRCGSSSSAKDSRWPAARLNG